MKKLKFTQEDKIALLEDMDYEIKEIEELSEQSIYLESNAGIHFSSNMVKHALKENEEPTSENKINQVFEKVFKEHLHPSKIEKMGIIFNKIEKFILNNTEF